MSEANALVTVAARPFAVDPAPSEHVSSWGWTKIIYDQVGKVRRLRNKPASYGWNPGRKNSSTSFWLRRPEEHLRKVLARRLNQNIVIITVREVDDLPRPTPLISRFNFIEEPQYSLPFFDSEVASAVAIKMLPFSGQLRFRPSVDLASLWVAGLQAHIRASKNRDEILSVLNDAVSEDFQDAFALRFKRLVGSIGNRLRYGHGESNLIATNGRFEIAFQHSVLDRFYIVPDQSTKFFYRLFIELASFLDGGGVVRGSWGALACEKGVMLINVAPRSDHNANWDLAEIIE